MAKNKIQEIDLPYPELQEKLALNMASTHSSIDVANNLFYKYQRRYNYTTPKSFLELINFYIDILEKKRGSI